MITATIMRILTTTLLCLFLLGCYSTKSSNHYRLQPTRSEQILESAVAISRGYTQARLNAKKAERERQLEELKLLLEALRLQMDVQRLQKLERPIEQLNNHWLDDTKTQPRKLKNISEKKLGEFLSKQEPSLKVKLMFPYCSPD